MIRAFLGIIIAFIITVLLMPLIIKLSYKLKVRQTILQYVDNHQSKSGTPTMGGIGIIIAVAVASLFLMRGQNSLMLVTLVVTVGYGIIGFLDDFIKVFFKRNKGLSAYQKIIFQVLIAGIVAYFAFVNENILGHVFIPFTFKEMNFGWLSIPFYIIVFLAFTNAVNLTDGLDGLASNVTAVYTIFFAIIVGIILFTLPLGQANINEYTNILIFCGALIGALIGFVCFNGFPAKIFMGDTGALALGGGLACLSIVTKLSLIVPIIGIMYVLTSMSVILQVGYYKLKKKRIFIMAPLHHHFERKGIPENKIVIVYTAITFIMGIITLLLTILLN